jgi:hypothetical protein
MSSKGKLCAGSGLLSSAFAIVLAATAAAAAADAPRSEPAKIAAAAAQPGSGTRASGRDGCRPDVAASAARQRTSKLRHVPSELDPCAASKGVAPAAPAASAAAPR